VIPDILRQVDLFASFDDVALAGLADRCSRRDYAAGDTVWRTGDPGDELLVIESGEFQVYGPDDADGPELLARVGPGECVGEMGLLLNERRSATVGCSRGGSVLVLDAAAFHEIVRDQRVLGQLAAVVARRAVALAQRRPVSSRRRVVAVVADDGVPGAGLVAAAIVTLARARLQQQAVLVRQRHHGRDVESATGTAAAHAHTGGPPVDVARGESLDSLVRALHVHLDERHLAVIDVAPGTSVDAALALADVVVHVTARAPGDERFDRVLTVVNQHVPTAPRLPIASVDPFVLPHDAAIDGASADEVAALVVEGTTLLSWTLERLVRKLFGVTVGLALGGGAAFGISHVGVLMAFEQAGIPVDLFAGTSFGAIVAVGAASGLSGAAMLDIARRIGNVRTTLSALDPTTNGTGLLAGRRLIRIFGPLIPQQDFNQLVRPCRAVATDIDTGARVELCDGRLDEAVRASCSIPLIFSPVRLGGRTLVDGGMVDPVPADVVREMGGDIVVAVNVVPQLEPGVSTALSRVFKSVSRLNPLSYLRGANGLPDVVDVLMNSLQVVQYELGNFRCLAADVRVDVDMSGFTWIEFYRALDIIERGRKAGEAAVPAVQAAIAARLATA
jgi:NTE family protein